MYTCFEHDNGHEVEIFFTLESEMEKIRLAGGKILDCLRAETGFGVPECSGRIRLYQLVLANGTYAFVLKDPSELPEFREIVAFVGEYSAYDTEH